MIRLSAFGACAAAALLLSLSACAGAGEAPGRRPPRPTTPPSTPVVIEREHLDWAEKALGRELWQTPRATRAAGGIAPGKEGTLEFTPAEPGRYRIALVCEGPSTVTLKISSADGPLGVGSTDCGTAVNTIMALPVRKLKATVDGADAEGMWAVAVAPAEAP